MDKMQIEFNAVKVSSDNFKNLVSKNDDANITFFNSFFNREPELSEVDVLKDSEVFQFRNLKKMNAEKLNVEQKEFKENIRYKSKGFDSSIKRKKTIEFNAKRI